MKKIEIGDIRTYNLRIPGGWKARVPEITTTDTDYVRAFTPVYMRQGMTVAGAQTECERRLREMFEGAWVYALRKAIGRWAVEYHTRFGDLDGFNPEYMSAAFVPAQQFGRAGNPYVGGMFAEMRRER
jgi:hypothetical protein